MQYFVHESLRYMINPFPNKPWFLQYKSFENTVWKGEFVRNEQFLLFSQCFLPVYLSQTRPCFYASAEQVFWKHWENEKFLLFSQCFLPVLRKVSSIFIKFEIVICKLVQFGRVKNLLFGKGLKNYYAMITFKMLVFTTWSQRKSWHLPYPLVSTDNKFYYIPSSEILEFPSVINFHFHFLP